MDINNKYIDKTWFVIVEIIVAIIYALSIFVQTIGYKEFWIMGLIYLVRIVSLALAGVAAFGFVNNPNKRTGQYVAFLFAGLISLDTCFNDSLNGLVFLLALLLCIVLVKNRVNKYGSVLDIFTVSVVTTEVICILKLINGFPANSMIVKSIGTVWIDVILVVVIALQMISGSKNNSNKKNVQIISGILVISMELLMILALGTGLYLRGTEYYIKADDIVEGDSVYVEVAESGTTALTYKDGLLAINKLCNTDEQIFTFEDSEDDGYWHIRTDNELVLDVMNVLFEENNNVIAWNENGVVGQHWAIEDAGNNLVRFVSYDDEYVLSWNEKDNSMIITNDRNDINTFFFLKNAKAVSFPLVGWIVNGNKRLVIAGYLLISVILFGVTCFATIKNELMNKVQR